MTPIPYPKNEVERLGALRRYDVLDTPSEETFDRITRLAKSILQTPIVLVSLVDESRQWFKSRQGLDTCETPRDISFCAHAILRDDVMVIPDALADDRFRDNPLVTGDPNVRFYAGAPLRTMGGYNIGTLCAIDQVPRELSVDQVNGLRDLAQMVVDELELRRLAATDSLTGALGRGNFFSLAEKEMSRVGRYGNQIGCVAFDLDHFKTVNDTHGHAVGDIVLQATVKSCQELLRPSDLLGRIGGEEFAVVLPQTGIEGTRAAAERLRQAIAGVRIAMDDGELSFTASFGATACAGPLDTAAGMLKRADVALYESKRAGRNRVTVAFDDDPATPDAVSASPSLCAASARRPASAA